MDCAISTFTKWSKVLLLSRPLSIFFIIILSSYYHFIPNISFHLYIFATIACCLQEIGAHKSSLLPQLQSYDITVLVFHCCHLWYIMILYDLPLCLYDFGNRYVLLPLSLSLISSLTGIAFAAPSSALQHNTEDTIARINAMIPAIISNEFVANEAGALNMIHHI